MRGLVFVAIILVAFGLVSNNMVDSKETKPKAKCTAAENSELAKLHEKCGDEDVSNDNDDSYECSDEDLEKLEMLAKKCGTGSGHQLLRKQKQQAQCSATALADCKERKKEPCIPLSGEDYLCTYRCRTDL